MDITAFDITILVASTIGIILMSFTFPALGLTGEATTEEEVPEFDISADRFDIAGEFPDPPQEGPERAMSGTIYLNNPNESDTDFILGDESHGWQMTTFPTPVDGEIRPSVQLLHWREGEVTQQDDVQNGFATLENEGDTAQFHTGFVFTNWGNVTAEVTAGDFQGQGVDNFSATIDYTFDCTTGCGDNGGGALTNLPLIGGLFEAGSDVAAGAVWIAKILIWGGVVAFELIVNGLTAMVDVLAFMFGLAEFLVTTYTEIVSAEGLAPWASVILVIPGIMLMAVWAKLAAVAVEVIWIG